MFSLFLYCFSYSNSSKQLQNVVKIVTLYSEEVSLKNHEKDFYLEASLVYLINIF